MGREEIARTYYEAARKDAFQRSLLRDGALLAFLAAVASVFAFALSKDGTQESKYLLLAVPYLAFAVALLIIHHNLVIHLIHEYLTKELNRSLSIDNENHKVDADRETSPPEWEKSATLSQWGLFLVILMFIIQVIVLILPSIVALLLVPKELEGPICIIRTIGWVLIFTTVAILFSMVVIRRRWADNS